MKVRISIAHKITALIVAVVGLGLLASAYFSISFSRRQARESELHALETVAALKAAKAKQWLALKEDDIKVFQKVLETNGFNPYAPEAKARFEALVNPLNSIYEFENIELINADAQVLARLKDNSQNTGTFLDPDGMTLPRGLKGLYLSRTFQDKGLTKAYLAAPINLPGAGQLVMVCHTAIDELLHVLEDTTSLGKTGEVVVLKYANQRILVQNQLRNATLKSLKLEVNPGDANNVAWQQAIAKKTGSGADTDYRNTETLAAWTYIPGVDWGIVVKTDLAEVYGRTDWVSNLNTLVSIGVVMLSLVILWVVVRFITRPLYKLKYNMELVSQGILPAEIKSSSQDELGEITRTLSHLVDGLKRTASFAHRIGEGDVEAEFVALSDQDILGQSLLSMRESLKDAANRDSERNWIIRGEAEVGDILRRHNDIEAMGDEIIAFVTHKIGAIQGAFYVREDDDNGRRELFMRSSYAYNKKKYLKARFAFGQGLVGQSAIEADTVLRTEIPDDYVTLSSGILGDKKPSCLLIVPLITNEEVNGVIEFAGLQRFTEVQVKFVQQISMIIARALFNIQVNERTRKLLEASQKMSAELQQQQEELRQNAEEMAATQEELYRSNQQLANQIEEVNRTQKRTQLLLENASEVITIYETDGTIRYISPSVTKILGYNPEALIGTNDLVHVHPSGQEAVTGMFAHLLEFPQERVTIQYSYQAKNGEQIWLESVGTNLLNDQAIGGILVNTRDITERRLAEREARMRGQMQALSENSPDLITRVNREGQFFYINPVVEEYTQLQPAFFTGKSLNDEELQGIALFDRWKGVINEVLTVEEKVAKEVDFPSVIGNRVIQVNAIPEYNEEQALESILLVSHDVTDRKLIELEIASKNKKITESINYAKRIQVAILPDTKLLTSVFADSFLLYRPRDVVSGDFPWFIEKEDAIYVAAVDCTGHGVPGALISLIGYFLLNNVMGEASSPGHILDLLDAAVTQTLKQDGSDSATRDGMDVALVKIHKNTRQVEYAGAHRPLYYLTASGELQEIKGDKFPIGGGQYKNRVNFTNHAFEYQEGESLVFCSDGFPDQFGGPENRKFGPKRIREILVENAQRPMAELQAVYEHEFDAWKGEGKQTDDVLMIGIRLHQMHFHDGASAPLTSSNQIHNS